MRYVIDLSRAYYKKLSYRKETAHQQGIVFLGSLSRNSLNTADVVRLYRLVTS